MVGASRWLRPHSQPPVSGPIEQRRDAKYSVASCLRPLVGRQSRVRALNSSEPAAWHRRGFARFWAWKSRHAGHRLLYAPMQRDVRLPSTRRRDTEARRTRSSLRQAFSLSTFFPPQPVVTVDKLPIQPIGLMRTDASFDEARRRLTDLAVLFARLGEAEAELRRLAMAQRKTQKRVNALKYNIVPRYMETARYCGARSTAAAVGSVISDVPLARRHTTRPRGEGRPRTLARTVRLRCPRARPFRSRRP